MHGVQLTDAELARARRGGRDRRHLSAQQPLDRRRRCRRSTRFYASGVRVAIGTDSLASVEDLNLFDELAAVRRLAPGVPAPRILRSATLDGAAALGFGGELGHDCAGQARRAHRRPRPGRASRMWKNTGEGHRADASWLDDLTSAGL